MQPPRTHVILCLIAGGSLLGCRPAGYKARTIAFSDLGSPEGSRLTSYLSLNSRIIEDTPDGIERSVVLDEVYLKQADGRICAALTMRSSTNHDQPLSEWSVTINGETAYPSSRETVTVADYDYTGERNIVDAAAVGQAFASTFRISEPEARVFRVVERQSDYCSSNVSAEFDFKAKYRPAPGASAKVMQLVWTFREPVTLAGGAQAMPASATTSTGSSAAAPVSAAPPVMPASTSGAMLDFVELHNGGSYKCTILAQDATSFKLQLLNGNIEIVKAADVLRVTKVAK